MPRGNPGIIIELADGRKAIVYHNQPLHQTQCKLLLHLIGDDYKPILGDDGKQKTLIKSEQEYHEILAAGKYIGRVD